MASFRSRIPNTDAALVLVVVIVAVAAAGHRPAGFVAAFSTVLWFDFYLTKPYERFAITRHTDIETTVLLLVVGVAVTEIAVRSRRHKMSAVEEADFVARIHSAAAMVAAGESAQLVVVQVAVQLTDLLVAQGLPLRSDRVGPTRCPDEAER